MSGLLTPGRRALAGPGGRGEGSRDGAGWPPYPSAAASRAAGDGDGVAAGGATGDAGCGDGEGASGTADAGAAVAGPYGARAASRPERS
jgi:hypothetical protein